MRRTIAGVIRAGQAAGEIAPGLEADQAGWRLTALVEGLGTWLPTRMVARELGE